LSIHFVENNKNGSSVRLGEGFKNIFERGRSKRDCGNMKKD